MICTRRSGPKTAQPRDVRRGWARSLEGRKEERPGGESGESTPAGGGPTGGRTSRRSPVKAPADSGGKRAGWLRRSPVRVGGRACARCGSPMAARRGIDSRGGMSVAQLGPPRDDGGAVSRIQVPGLARSSALAAPRPGPTGNPHARGEPGHSPRPAASRNRPLRFSSEPAGRLTGAAPARALLTGRPAELNEADSPSRAAAWPVQAAQPAGRHAGTRHKTPRLRQGGQKEAAPLSWPQ
jgi:hypothetical protein